ncbi:MAG: YidC/Oxa1 family membrane protein insertase [Chloroflexi bacterium]|nr:YidC/Oxa1 family membrane protein insertase [Chloroflexota bacterium]MCY3581720.1 YidC/Oxa1 family membrane protein insertase [Chloroflexota bacterium]MCY3716306.1 YidC/Oxa1 family membrane protein insertase [Chloroflexota bacterium]MDE2651325.1 YidC/Oxa1 family membrane protein insertase [Chloroflexota bacterium]MXV92967.1 YidC/Oxa1 family membrane protein insertase [Chloroflexota bacterium]
MWDLILNPFVTILAWLYSALNQDIVLAIVVLTVIIRVLTWPLFAKQQESSRRMQQVQPQLKKLQEKYKNDKEKLSQAQMKLYRENKVNPVGGCFPMLIQFPILIGLYQAIFYALAATPFQLVDLSERLLIPGLDSLIPLQRMWSPMPQLLELLPQLDLTRAPTENPPYALLLPLLVLVTTWAQQKLTMSMTGQKSSKNDDDDEADSNPGGQAAAMTKSMTTIMPIMFGFFSLSFSVGLSIYFVTSNLIGMVQYSPQGRRVLERIFGGKGDEAPVEVIFPDDDVADEPSPKKLRRRKKKKPRKK